MITAQELRTKYEKESTKRFRATKGVATRVLKCAKAGLTSTKLEVALACVDEIEADLKAGGYSTSVEKGKKVAHLSVSW